jgi:hypothetical protein
MAGNKSTRSGARKTPLKGGNRIRTHPSKNQVVPAGKRRRKNSERKVDLPDPDDMEEILFVFADARVLVEIAEGRLVEKGPGPEVNLLSMAVEKLEGVNRRLNAVITRSLRGRAS